MSPTSQHLHISFSSDFKLNCPPKHSFWPLSYIYMFLVFGLFDLFLLSSWNLHQNCSFPTAYSFLLNSWKLPLDFSKAWIFPKFQWPALSLWSSLSVSASLWLSTMYIILSSSRKHFCPLASKSLHYFLHSFTCLPASVCLCVLDEGTGFWGDFYSRSVQTQ